MPDDEFPQSDTASAQQRPVGERGLLIDAADPHALATQLRLRSAHRGLALREVIPGARTVLVELERAVDREALQQLVMEVLHREGFGARGDDGAARCVTIPVVFDGADLADVAARVGLGVDAVIAMVVRTTFTAQFTGFAPGFAYLGGLASRLWLPRRASPRTRVPAGSLAIADRYAGIYPNDGPGGWHLLGTTDVTLFDPDRAQPALITPGTDVRFVEVRP